MTDDAPETIAEAVEDEVGEKLGIERWDRPEVYRAAADAATDADLPYWLILALSGAIATLGLALDSAAVVIGAMLVAPLLAPVVGLALALAVGDGRLVVQTGAVVAGSTLIVVATAAGLTLLLPFHTITLEISARIRPSTLDLAVAVCSGLAGAVVTVARERRLSAAIPGVAVAVALIPPLAVAGFGMGSGWNERVIWGSLLLYGANLVGIVLSGTVLFLLVGMHRSDVLDAARQWHERRDVRRGLAPWIARRRGIRSLGVFDSVWARIGLVVAFAGAFWLPLRASLAEIAREARVRSVVDSVAETLFEKPGRSSVIEQRIAFEEDAAAVRIRIATREWYHEDTRDAFERTASERAGEPIQLVLEQIPAAGGEPEALSRLFPGPEPAPAPPPSPIDALEDVRQRLERARPTLRLPGGAVIVGTELVLRDTAGPILRVAYTAAQPLTAAAEDTLVRRLSDVIEMPRLEVRAVEAAE